METHHMWLKKNKPIDTQRLKELSLNGAKYSTFNPTQARVDSLANPKGYGFMTWRDIDYSLHEYNN